MIVFYHMYVCCCIQLLCLLPSLASQKLVPRGNTSRASNSQKPSYFQRVHYKFLCMVFQAIPVNFHVLPFKNLQILLILWHYFLAHEDVVVEFVIFHTELSTPRLACFICSSLILQGSWSDHYKKKRKRKKALFHGMWKLVGTRWNRLPWFVKGKSGRSAKL
jgi:hypothetical protein